MSNSLFNALHAPGPATDRAAKMASYAWLIGDWTFDATLGLDDGSEARAVGEIHAGWVLEGRAIQDVWILPGYFTGSTLRVYDPGIDAWHILWSDPLRQYYNRQIGRVRGADIVQEGRDDTGAATRWSFVEIGADSFRWLGERRREEETTWRLIADFTARRTAG